MSQLTVTLFKYCLTNVKIMKGCSNKTVNTVAILAALHIITAPKNPNRVHWFDVITSTVMSWLAVNAIILLCVLDQIYVPWKTINICFIVLYIWYFSVLRDDDVAAINEEKEILKRMALKQKRIG